MKTASPKLRQEEMEFHFSNFKNQPYHKEPEELEEKTIAQLTTIYFGTPKDELRTSLSLHEQGP